MGNGPITQLMGSHDYVQEGETIICRNGVTFNTKPFLAYARAIYKTAEAKGIDPKTIEF